MPFALSPVNTFILTTILVVLTAAWILERARWISERAATGICIIATTGTLAWTLLLRRYMPLWLIIPTLTIQLGVWRALARKEEREST